MRTRHTQKHKVGRPSGLRKTIGLCNSLAHRTTWLRSDFSISSKSRTAISYHQTQSLDEKTTSIASYPNSPPNENPAHSKAHCRHLSPNHDNKPPRYNSQDRSPDLPPRRPFPAAYELTLTSHRNTGHQQQHAQQKHRATKAASDAKARAPPPMKYAADYRHWIRFASLSAVSGTL